MADVKEWERHTAECPARAGSVYYCECGADPTRARGVEIAEPTAEELEQDIAGAEVGWDGATTEKERNEHGDC